MTVETYLFLKVAWWLLLGVLLLGIAVMMGTDMVVGAMLRWVGRTDVERRVALNVIGPHWDGNQVWFVLGGGAMFAAWPLVYATAFSGLYVVMLVLLWSMIIRPLGFEYRSKLSVPAWRNAWDWVLFVSGVVPMLVFGAAIGNLFLGLPFQFRWNLTSWYDGNFVALFNPFALLCGGLSLAMAATRPARRPSAHASMTAWAFDPLPDAITTRRGSNSMTRRYAPAPADPARPERKVRVRGVKR